MILPRVLAVAACLASWLAQSCAPSLKPLPPVEEVIRKAREGDNDALGSLVRYFASPMEEEASKAFTALMEAKDRAVPHLLTAVEGNDAVLAEWAAGALGNIRDRRAVAALIKSLDRPGHPKYVIVWALGEIGDEEAIGPLIRQLGDKNREIRKYSARALIKFGPKAVPAAIKALDDPGPGVRHYAARVLGQSGDARAAGPLMEHYRALDPEAALWALGRIGAREALPLITGAVSDPDWKIRLAAVQALAALADGRAMPVLKKALEDEEWVVREWAARALEDITVERQLYRDQYGKMVVPYNLYR
jgi:HEAT repeat protein